MPAGKFGMLAVFLIYGFILMLIDTGPFRTSSRCPFDKVCSFNQKIRLKVQIGTKHFGHGKYTLFNTFVYSRRHSPFKRAIKVGGKCQIDGGNLIITLCLLLSGDVHQCPGPFCSNKSIGAAACYNREGQKGRSNDSLSGMHNKYRSFRPWSWQPVQAMRGDQEGAEAGPGRDSLLCQMEVDHPRDRGRGRGPESQTPGQMPAEHWMELHYCDWTAWTQYSSQVNHFGWQFQQMRRIGLWKRCFPWEDYTSFISTLEVFSQDWGNLPILQ